MVDKFVKDSIVLIQQLPNVSCGQNVIMLLFTLKDEVRLHKSVVTVISCVITLELQSASVQVAHCLINVTGDRFFPVADLEVILRFNNLF